MRDEPENCIRNPSNRDSEGFEQSPAWQPEEIQLDDDKTLTFRSYLIPPNDFLKKRCPKNLGKAVKKTTLATNEAAENFLDSVFSIPLSPKYTFSPAFGLATGSSNGLHLRRKFLAA
jgi:hypothetical protein